MIRIPRTVCFDCARLGGCNAAEKVYTNQGAEALLQHHCKDRWKNCSPAAFAARAEALKNLGMQLALRGITNTPLPKEESVTRAEREAELKEMHRLDLRKLAIQKGFPHNKSLRAESEEMREHVLAAEFPGEGAATPTEEAPAPKKPTKKASPRKKVAPEPAPDDDENTDDGGCTVDITPVMDGLSQLGTVLDSHAGILEDHSGSLSTLHERQSVIAKALFNVCCLYLEPSDVDAIGFESAFPEIFEEPDPS